MDGNERSYVFITHKCLEHEATYTVIDELEARGFPCWIDKRDIGPGDDWSDEIHEKLDGAAAVIWIKSPLSAISDEVLKELKLATHKSKLIIPLVITEVAKLQPRWDSIIFLQEIWFNDPAWADVVARRLLKLDGFVPASVGTPEVESIPSPTGVPHVKWEHQVPTSVLSSANQHDPFALIRSDGRTYQLDGLNGLSESLVEDGDVIMTGDLGVVAVSSDASVIATSDGAGEVELWALGAADAMRGPVLSAVLPAEAGSPRLLAVDRPLGQATRVIACGTDSAYSLMQRTGGEWTAMRLIDGDEPIVSGAVVKDDVLFVRANGSTVWASSRSKRPFSLPKIYGVDAAVGTDGRYYLAGWGSGRDGSSLVEVVVEVDSGWERIHRGPGGRAGIVRVIPDVVFQNPGAAQISLAVQDGERSVTILRLP